MYPQREEKNSISILRRASAVFGPKIFCTASTFSNPLKNSVNRWYFTGTVRGIVTPTERGLNLFALAMPGRNSEGPLKLGEPHFPRNSARRHSAQHGAPPQQGSRALAAGRASTRETPRGRPPLCPG